MTYNPFDDVIEQDPAYMQTGINPQRSVIPQRRVNYPDDGQSERMADIVKAPLNLYGDIMAQTLGRIAENMVNPEAAERGRQKSAIRKEAQRMFDKVPGQMTADDIRFYEQRTGNKYEQLTFQEGINSGLNFILEDAIKGSQAIQQGKKFTELSGTEQLGVGILPLEFWLGGAGGRKAVQEVGGEILSKYKDMPLGELVANPQARQEIPEVVAEIENQFPVLITQQQRVTPDQTPGVAMAPDTGRSAGGQFTGTVTKENLTNAVNNYFKNNPNEKISTKRLSENLGLEKNYSLLKGIYNKKTFPNNVINEADLKAKEEIKNVMSKIKNSNIEDVSLKKLAKDSGTTIGKLRYNLVTRREENLKNGIITQEDIDLFDSVLSPGKTPQVKGKEIKINKLKKDLLDNPEKQGQTVAYYTQNYDIPKSTLVTAKQNDPELYALTTRTDREGVPVEFTTADEQTFYAKGKAAGKVKSLEESDFLFDLYRGRKNELNITEEQFFNQLPNNWRDKTTNTFNSYKKLEAERKSLQNDNYDFFREIYEDPDNKRILGNTFEQDQGNFTLDKAHAYFIGDATKEGRMADMSLYEDMMYISPKGSNIRVQEAFDKPIRQITNFFTDPIKRAEFKNIKLSDTTITALERQTGVRINSMISSLRKNGIEFNINDFETLDELFYANHGGPVRMAIGGDPLQNINQQQFAPDPAIDEDYFQQAVDSGNLTAFNPLKLFRLFGKVDAVQTPKKITAPKEVDAPEGTTLPATQEIQPQDFPFKSFTLESIMDPNAPKADQPQGWANFLFKGKNVPKSELNDSGLTQFLTDYEKYFPGQKVTQQQLIDYYETSPIGNLSFKVKDEARREISNPQYDTYAGRPRHQDAGNQPLDQQGEDYREIVVEAGPLPGEKKPFVQSGHYNEPNVIGFTRVANYTQPDGKRVAVIQEMQTDMLSKVRKEQERLRAFMTRLENVKQKADETIRRGDDDYYTQRAQDALRGINNKYPPTVMKALEENASLIKPFPNQAAASTIPTYAKQLQDLQSQIDQIVKSDLQQSKPETVFQVREISEKQGEVLNSLLDLNRSGQLDNILKDIKIPSSSSTEDLNRFALGDDSFQVEENYGGKALELFPPIPFNKQPDYVDLLIKATIKDAQSKGINKVAIYPADLVNRRWGKTPGDSSAKKFEDLYGKVAVQQMKNIAKKYDGVAQFEVIVDSTKPTKGLRFLKKNVNGDKFELLKEDVVKRDLDPNDVNSFFDGQIKRMAQDMEDSEFKNVVLTKEIAPNQTMDYYVQVADNEKGYILQPLGEGDKIEDALIVIEEFNPQQVPMFTITLDSPKAEQPMYLFKKKDGGSIAKDSLVSVTDIYGEYGR
jgi:hypothetical protein